VFALYPKPSYLKTSILCTQVQIFIKKEFYFIKKASFGPRVFQARISAPLGGISGVAGISAPWAEYPGWLDYPRKIGPDNLACMAMTYIRAR
jgi:hypothetical protein